MRRPIGIGARRRGRTRRAELRGVTRNHGISQSSAAKPTAEKLTRQPKCVSIHGTSTPSTTSPVRVPASNRPLGSARSPAGRAG